MTFDEQFDHGTEIELDRETRELLNPEDERRRKFNNLIDVIRKSETFYMPNIRHSCGTPACILGHCRAHFRKDLCYYLGISDDHEAWLVDGHFSSKDWHDITKEEAATALEMVRDKKVPDDPFEPEVFTID